MLPAAGDFPSGPKDSMPDPIPDYCDFICPHAEFPPANTAGICRTMSAVWCKKLKSLVNKNVLCEWRRKNEAAGSKQRRAKRRE